MAQNLEFEHLFDEEKATGFRDRMHSSLFDIGIPPRLQKAVHHRVPREISDLGVYSCFPSKPFGLIGEGGCGKSCALVHGIKATLLRDFHAAGPARWEEVLPTPGKPHAFEGTRLVQVEPKHEFRWVGWPSLASRMKGFAARRDWDNPQASTGPLLSWLKAYPERRILVLDDLGMENTKVESYTNEQLEVLIDDAYNWEARVYWTSNHIPEALEKIYGYRLVSRLIGLSPDVILPKDMPDLRIQ